MLVRKIILSAFLLGLATLVSATTPVVVVQSPTSGGVVGSPVNFVASASSSGCSKGIAAMRIYTAPGVGAYTVDANSLNANINLPMGSYSTDTVCSKVLRTKTILKPPTAKSATVARLDCGGSYTTFVQFWFRARGVRPVRLKERKSLCTLTDQLFRSERVACMDHG